MSGTPGTSSSTADARIVVGVVLSFSRIPMRADQNDWNRTGYGGPCPPIGRHRYFHKLYALDEILPDLGTPTKAKLEKVMAGHIIAQAELVGTYERTK